MNRLCYKIRERKHREREHRLEWIMLAVCIAGSLLAIALAWAREDKLSDCYFSAGREMQIGKWRSVGDGVMACIKR